MPTAGHFIHPNAALPNDDAVAHVQHAERMPVNQQPRRYRERIDAAQFGGLEARHHERVVERDIDIHGELEGRRDFRHVGEHRISSDGPLQLIVLANQTHEVFRVGNREIPAPSVVESEMSKTAPDKVPFEVEVHRLVDDPVVH